MTQTAADFDKHQAVVTYDDAKVKASASADQIMRATANAGYPSTIKGAPSDGLHSGFHHHLPAVRYLKSETLPRRLPVVLCV